MRRGIETRLKALEAELRAVSVLGFGSRPQTPGEVWQQILELFRWPQLRFSDDGRRVTACFCPAPPHRLAALLSRQLASRGHPLFVLLTIPEIDALLDHQAAGHFAFGQGDSRDRYYTVPTLECWTDMRVVTLGRALDAAMANWRRQAQQPCPLVCELPAWLADMRSCLTRGSAFDPTFDF